MVILKVMTACLHGSSPRSGTCAPGSVLGERCSHRCCQGAAVGFPGSFPAPCPCCEDVGLERGVSWWMWPVLQHERVKLKLVFV